MGKLYKRLSYNSITIDKLIIEVIKAKEGLDPFYNIRGFPVIDYLNLLKINFNSFYSNNKPKVIYRLYLNLYFLILTYKPIFYSLFKTFLI